ncbi:MAG: hypothetical protein U0T77_08470 [Chitinophagales bacterium]
MRTPQQTIDKCNPNRIAMEIEVYDITSNLVNRRRNEKMYWFKLDYKITDNQLHTVIAHKIMIGPSALTDNTSQQHYRLDVINQPNYLVKDLPNFRLEFRFKLHDVSFTRLARVYERRIIDVININADNMVYTKILQSTIKRL